jgi:hypothetical protein
MTYVPLAWNELPRSICMHETHTNVANEIQIVRDSSYRNSDASAGADRWHKLEVYFQVGWGFG